MATPAWQADNPYASFGTSVAESGADTRVAFVRKTYLHLTVAIYALVMLDWLIISSGVIDSVMPTLMSGYNMLFMFLGFIAVSWAANWMAHSQASRGMQYLGLSLYVVAQAIFLAPLLYFAQDMTLQVAGDTAVGVIPAAGLATLLVFAALTAAVWMTGADFSFLRTGLMIASGVAVALIVASVFIGGLTLGVWFSVAMVALAAGYILYDTSNVMHHYHESQYVAASLALFASVVLLFWYILRLFMALSSRD